MAIHIGLWLLYGLTLSPVEPSEAMYTLHRGAVNAGFVFFVAAIASTLIFGRYFCGWGCHIVALQDLCAWLMKKVGVHPRPFRTRLLVFAPVALAFYMFAWPTFRREVLVPVFGVFGTALPTWIGPVGDRPAMHAEFLVQDFWATFPPWWVAIPFLGVCGFAVVYFLGAKGFCTYGCPYGGIFGPADLIAPGRIIVNDRCEHCGHCTAVCTSNVRVHEEVRDFGMVVDPGCMKCMDCVSVCPNNALSFGFAAPPPLNARVKAGRRTAKPRANFDLTLPQEVVFGLVGLALFIGFRGMFDKVPMLMAMGLAAIGAFAAWKLWCMVRVPHVRLQSLQLRYRGHWTPSGWVFAGFAVALLGAGAWGAAIRYHLWRGEVLDAQVTAAPDAVFAPGYQPDPAQAALADRAAAMLTRAGSPSDPGGGGFGWPRAAEVNVRLAWLHAVRGRRDLAEAVLRRVIEQHEPGPGLMQNLAQLLQLRGATPPEYAALYRRVIELYPADARPLLALAFAEAQSGRPAEAVAAARRVVTLRPGDPGLLAATGNLLMQLEAHRDAADAFHAASDADPKSGVLKAEWALALLLSNQPAAALARMAEAISLEPGNAALYRRQADVLGALGRHEEATEAMARAAALESGR